MTRVVGTDQNGEHELRGYLRMHSTWARSLYRKPGRPQGMKKISTMRATENGILKKRQCTIGLDLGDRWSFYYVLDEVGEVLREEKLSTTPEAMKQTFAGMARSRIAMEAGTHSPWVSRLLTKGGTKSSRRMRET